MTSHRGRRRIPVRQLAVSVAAAIAVGAGSYSAFHDPAPVTVIPVGSVSPLPTPTPSVSPLTGVRRPVPVCWAGSPAMVGHCVTQDPQDVVDGSAVTR